MKEFLFDSKTFVILDNGHGIDTPGKRSPVWGDKLQLLEYEFNRDIVGKISNLLKVADQTWITLEKSSSSGNDSIDVTVSTNSSTNSRVGTVTITSSSMTLYVTVSQYGANYTGSSGEPLTDAQICAMLHPGDPQGFQSCLDAASIG